MRHFLTIISFLVLAAPLAMADEAAERSRIEMKKNKVSDVNHQGDPKAIKKLADAVTSGHGRIGSKAQEFASKDKGKSILTPVQSGKGQDSIKSSRPTDQ